MPKGGAANMNSEAKRASKNSKNSNYSLFKRVSSFILILTFLFSFATVNIFAAGDEATYKATLRSAGFPELYLDKLWKLHVAHPTWEFEAYNTGLDWDAAVAAESSGSRCLVYIASGGNSATRLYRSMSVGSYTSKAGFDYDYAVRDGSDANQTGWIDATPMAVAYYMNPYTFIGDEVTIMQFEKLSWNFASIAEAEAIVETMLAGSFMSKTPNARNANYIDASGNITYKDASGGTVGTSQTYANAICVAAQAKNVNPCYLTSKIIGEVGNSGSGSTTGTHGTYPGYYNYLNIGATDSSDGTAVTNGLKKAKDYGWTSPQASIAGGAEIIADSYISRGQDTPYLQKFNVTPTNTYDHQYMTAVNGVVNTTYSTYKGYKTSGRLEDRRVFKIPVFTNMPNYSGDEVKLSGYTNAGTVTETVNKRQNAGVDYSKVGSVAAGSAVTIYGGYRDQRVTYSAAYGTDSLFYRMYNPLWYKIDGGYVCEDFVNNAATETLKVGATHSFKYAQPSGNEKPRFMSQDTRIATVDKNGLIRAVGIGTTKVVAYLVNGSFAVLKINVTNSADGVPSALSSSTYSINNGSSFVSRISQGTSVGTLKNGLNEKAYVVVTKNGATLSDSNTISTGCIVSIKNGSQVIRSYTAIVTGDININNGVADGKITITDLLAIRDELLSGTGKLSGVNYKAADVTGDGKVTITDLLSLRDYLLGAAGITPRAY